MGDFEMPNDHERQVVAVTKDGETTIPKQFREKLGIEAPGKVLFRETENGDVIVDQVRSPSEMRGFADRSKESKDIPATEILREFRDQN